MARTRSRRDRSEAPTHVRRAQTISRVQSQNRQREVSRTRDSATSMRAPRRSASLTIPLQIRAHIARQVLNKARLALRLDLHAVANTVEHVRIGDLNP